MSAISEFRKKVKTNYPHVKVQIKTWDFQDLARASAKGLTVTGDKTHEELATINAWAKEAGILPDSSMRMRGDTWKLPVTEVKA